MGIEVTATNVGLPQQPIYITVHVNDKEKKQESACLPGSKVYWMIEGFMHLGIVGRTAMECENICQPIYQNTYLIAATAGIVYGLYKARKGKPREDIAERAKVFAESEWRTKAWAVAEQAMMMTGSLKLAESKILAEGLTAGSLVAGYWGFNLGANMAGVVYKNLISSDT